MKTKVTTLNIRSTKGAEVIVKVTRSMETYTRTTAEDGVEVTEHYDTSNIEMTLEGKTYNVKTGTYKSYLLLISDKDHVAVSISKEDCDKIINLTMEDILAGDEPEKEEKKEESDPIMNIPERKRRKLERNYDNLWNEGGDGYNPYRVHE